MQRQAGRPSTRIESSPLPLDAFQIRRRPARSAESMCLPSLEKSAAETLSSWPGIFRNSFPVFAYQTRTVLSALPETIRRPSRLRATSVTRSPWALIEAMDLLGAAYEEAGRWEDAKKTARRAIILAESANKKLVPGLNARLNLYDRQQAYRQRTMPK